MSLPTRIGKFEILRRLGKGAMGEVFLAKDPVLGREVAIKTILANSAFGEEAKARFEREARATAALNHPNIVTVYEFGENEGLHYLAMEYLEGEDLEALIRQKGLARPELLEVLAQVCEGLAYAHERGVIHRDIKPSNVLVVRKGRRLQAKLMDFGVAMLNQSDLTQQGVWMGTANYMAPEYLDSGKASISSDLFAVGVMLYEVLANGRKPFTGETTTTVLNAILRHPPAPFLPTEIDDVSSNLLDVVHRSLDKDPQNRYSSAEMLCTAIRQASLAPAGTFRDLKTEIMNQIPSKPVKESPTKTIVVGRGAKANCLSLRVALRQAEPGTVILVLPGIYKESLQVDKDITIKGEGNASEVVLESSGGPCLTFLGGEGILQGLTFQRSTSNREGDAPELVSVRSGKCSFIHCTLMAADGTALVLEGTGSTGFLTQCQISGGSHSGMEIRSGASATFEDCHWEGQRRRGLVLESNSSANLSKCRFQNSEGTAVLLRGSTQITMQDCEVDGYRGGSLEIANGARAELKRCKLLSSHFAGLLALGKAQATLEDCEISGHDASGAHAVEGASLTLHRCQLHHNQGFGLSVMNRGLSTLDDCDFHHNAHPGVFIHNGGTVQIKNTKLHDGQSLGIVCASRGKGVLEGCEIFGNAQSGAKVEPGGSLLLVRCVLRDGQDTGLLLFEDAELTLEECVVHRNARGGILLAKDASDPILRGGNKIEDDLLRSNPQGGLIKLAPVKRH